MKISKVGMYLLQFKTAESVRFEVSARSMNCTRTFGEKLNYKKHGLNCSHGSKRLFRA